MITCCDLHNRHCEPPGDLCCHGCSEVLHPQHPAGVRCVLDVAADADREAARLRLHAVVERHARELGNAQPPRWQLTPAPTWVRWQTAVARDLCRTPGAHAPGYEVREFPCPLCLLVVAEYPEATPPV